jgi:hypothetical protein
MRSAIIGFMERAVQLLAEQMPYKRGGGKGRHAHGNNGTMDEFRKELLNKNVETLRRQNEKEAEEAEGRGPGSAVAKSQLLIRPDGPTLEAKSGVKRKRLESNAESDDDPAIARDIDAYEQIYPTFRFSCMTKRVIYDLLVEDVQDGKLTAWPRKNVKCGTLEDGTKMYQSVWWIPSLTYFLRIVRTIGNIFFWKNPTFTKCNTCVQLRNCARKRTIAQAERDFIRKARNQHCFYIMSEVLKLLVVSA